MTLSREPDYIHYTLEQLERARRSIDVERFPDRSHLLDVLIADRKLRQAESLQGQPNPQETADHGDGWFTSHRNERRYNTPGQALLGMAATVVFGAGGFAWMWSKGLQDNSMKLFAGLWVLVNLFGLAHTFLEYRRLKALTSVVPQQPVPAPVNPTANRPVSKPISNSNTSPVQRL